MRSFDILGSMAIVKFPRGSSVKEKKKRAEKIMKDNNGIKTVLEKVGKFKGRLRKMETKFVAGEKTKEVLYRENGCVFRFNVDKTYFSPRLSNERKEIADKIKKSDKVLVMFAGVAPFSIVIAKQTGAKVYSNEVNRLANKYARLNAELNGLKNNIVFVDGDIKRIAQKLSHPPHIKRGSFRSQLHGSDPDLRHGSSLKKKFDNKDFVKLHKGLSVKFFVNTYNKNRATLERDKFSEVPRYFDVIVMPRPQLKDSFLKEAFSLSRKGTRIYYYDFCDIDDRDKIIGKVKQEAKKFKKKIKIIKSKVAGEIAPYKVRYRVDFRVL